MTNYPAALDTLTNPGSQDTMLGVPHSEQHANANDAIEALQAKLGTDSQPAQLPKAFSFTGASDAAILVDGAVGWADLEGALVPKATGAGSPSLQTFQGQRRWFAYNNGDDMDSIFHIPHDWAFGSDLYLHLHWAHNGTNISGTSIINYYLSFGKGHNQAPFSAEVNITQTIAGLNLTNTPQYQTRIDEFVITTPGGGPNLLDINEFEIDGLLHIHFDWTQIPTITGGAGRPFGFYLDLHYQSTGLPTKNKAPNFYT